MSNGSATNSIPEAPGPVHRGALARRMSSHLLSLLLAGLLGLAPQSGRAQTSLQDLGTLGGTTARAEAVNASGIVVGSSATAGGNTHAFLWNGSPAGPMQVGAGPLQVGIEHVINASPGSETMPMLGNDGTSDLVVYTGEVAGVGEMFYQRLDTAGAPVGAPVRIPEPTDGTGVDTNAQLNDVSGDFIVYTAQDPIDSSLGHLMLYRISTGSLQELATENLLGERPRIEGTSVVWLTSEPVPGTTQVGQSVWLYDFAAGLETRIAGPMPPAFDVQIGGGYVVWTQFIPPDFEVFSLQYRIPNDFPTQLTSSPSLDEHHPASSGDWVVYEVWPQATGANIWIEARNTQTGETRSLTACPGSGACDNGNPNISGELVTWQSDASGSYGVWAHSLATGETLQLTGDTSPQYLSDVFGGLVAYVDDRSGNQDVYVRSGLSGPMLDLGTLGGASSQAFDLSDAGEVVGVSQALDGSLHGFRIQPQDRLPAPSGDGLPDTWFRGGGALGRNGLMVDLGPAASLAISDAGPIVGHSPGSVPYAAALWSASGVRTDLGKLIADPTANAEARGVNDAGTVVGWSQALHAGALTTRPFRIDPLDADADGLPDTWFQDADGDGLNDLMTDLVAAGPFHLWGTARDVNAAGQVVGTVRNLPLGEPDRAVLWQPGGGQTLLETLGGSRSFGEAINGAGLVAGRAETAAGPLHAFLGSGPGGLIDLGALAAGQTSAALDLGPAGEQVVGWADDASGAPRAVRWTVLPNTAVGPLQSVSPDPGLTLTFDEVTRPGLSAATHSATNPAPTGNFQFHGDFVDVATSAGFAGGVTLTLAYDPVALGLSAADEAGLQLLHLENDAWVDVTTGRNPAAHEIQGRVTSFSPFALAAPTPPPPPNHPPVADAGPDQTIFLGDSILLQGSATDPDGDAIVAWQWTVSAKPAGSLPIFTPTDARTPVFTPDLLGDYTLSLSAFDGALFGQPDFVTIHVVDNQPPVALATADITSGPAPLTVHFDGSGSFDPEGGALAASWLFGDGAAAPAGLVASHTYTLPGTYLASITIVDDVGQIAEDTILITVTDNQPPVADAGADQNLYLGETALLDGTASSDADGQPLNYLWNLDSAPAGSAAAPSCSDCAGPSLTPDRVGDYVLSLVVNDGALDSAADTVTLSVSENLPPVASATGSPSAGSAPLSVFLDARASSDPESQALRFAWDFGDGSSASGPGPGDLATVAHDYSAVGDYTAVVTVTDPLGNTDQAAVAISVAGPNLPPTPAPTATPSSGDAPLLVAFGAGGSDPDGDPLTYTWDFGDGGTSTDAAPQHTYATPGTFTARVSVSDGVNPAVSAEIVISVGSALSIHVREAKFDSGEHGRVKGKVTLKASFVFPGLPAAADAIRMVFDGVTLLDAPFGDFRSEPAEPGEYEYKQKHLHAKLDFAKGEFKVSRHKLLLGGVDNRNGIDVLVAFGASVATDHFAMQEDEQPNRGRAERKEMHHKRD